MLQCRFAAAGPVTVDGGCRVAQRLYVGMRVVLSCGGMKKVGRRFGITRNFVYLQSGSALTPSVRRRCPNVFGSSSVGRALASQAKGHGFESRLPLGIFVYTINDMYFRLKFM